MGTYKLLICDIDGTLMNQENPISVETKKALRGLSERGVGVTLATGRNLWEAQDIVKDLGITLPVILANGAQIYDFSTDGLLYGKNLNFREVQEFLKEQVPLSALVSWHDGTQWEHGSVRELLFHSPGVVMKRLLITLSPGKKLEDQDDSLFWVFWDGDNQFEITPKRARKGDGLVQLLRLLSIEAHETVALGNDENDISLLQTSGIGLAVGDAHDALKQRADGVVLPLIEHPLVKITEWMSGKLPWERIVIQE